MKSASRRTRGHVQQLGVRARQFSTAGTRSRSFTVISLFSPRLLPLQASLKQKAVAAAAARRASGAEPLPGSISVSSVPSHDPSRDIDPRALKCASAVPSSMGSAGSSVLAAVSPRASIGTVLAKDGGDAAPTSPKTRQAVGSSQHGEAPAAYTSPADAAAYSDGVHGEDPAAGAASSAVTCSGVRQRMPGTDVDNRSRQGLQVVRTRLVPLPLTDCKLCRHSP